MPSYMSRYPRISDLEARAQKRMPPFVGAYLFSGTGMNDARDRTVSDFRNVHMVPRFLRGRLSPSLETTFANTHFKAPFSVAPIGLSSLIWPGSEKALVKSCQSVRIWLWP